MKKKPPPPLPLKQPAQGWEDTVEIPLIEVPAETTCPWCHKPIEVRRVKEPTPLK